MSLTRSAYALCVGLAVAAMGCAVESPTAPVLNDSGTAAKVVNPWHHHTPLPAEYVKGEVGAVGKYMIWLVTEPSAGPLPAPPDIRVAITEATSVMIDGKPSAWHTIEIGYGLYAEGAWIEAGVFEASYIEATSPTTK
jgi:hypothetical protein